jgi:hypothetical protein
VYAAAVDLCKRLGIDVPWVRRWYVEPRLNREEEVYLFRNVNRKSYRYLAAQDDREIPLKRGIPRTSRPTNSADEAEKKAFILPDDAIQTSRGR